MSNGRKPPPSRRLELSRLPVPLHFVIAPLYCVLVSWYWLNEPIAVVLLSYHTVCMLGFGMCAVLDAPAKSIAGHSRSESSSFCSQGRDACFCTPFL